MSTPPVKGYPFMPCWRGCRLTSGMRSTEVIGNVEPIEKAQSE